jgi:hypothetical protein
VRIVCCCSRCYDVERFCVGFCSSIVVLVLCLASFTMVVDTFPDPVYFVCCVEKNDFWLDFAKTALSFVLSLA